MGGLQVPLPTLADCLASFDQKRHNPHAPPSLFTGSHPSNFLWFSGIKEVPKGKCFVNVEEVKQKTATLKGIKIYEFKNCFEQWKKYLYRCIALNGKYLEGD